MTTIIGTNPVLPSGDTWNTTTYPPESVLDKYGGSTAQFDVDSGAVILNGSLHISGDTGIEFSIATLNEVDPIFVAGSTEITYDATQNFKTGSGDLLVEVISINGPLPITVINPSIRITLEAYRNDNAYNAGGKIRHKRANGAQVGFEAAIPASAGIWTAFSFDFTDVLAGDYFEIYVFGTTTQIGTNKNNQPIYKYTTGYTRYVRSRTDGSAWQSTYPNAITRANS